MKRLLLSKLVMTDDIEPILQKSPTVAIVGRPNVGKSSIFNRLAERKIAIVLDQPGITRDRVHASCKMTDIVCNLVDTGGIGEDADEDFTNTVQTEAEIAMSSSDVILFVVDARQGLQTADESIAKILRKASKNTPIELVLNKCDTHEFEHMSGDFAKLGFGEGIPVSAEHGLNFSTLIETLNDHFSTFEAEVEEVKGQALSIGLKIAMVGRPNAGKSSLVNAIMNDERTIVSEISGTTRDAVDIPYRRGKEKHTLIDTAGLRPRSKRDTSVEVFSAMRTEKAIRRADLVLLVVDLAEGVSAMDRKIARTIQTEGKPCIIIANKFDLYSPDKPKPERMQKAKEHLRDELFFLHYAPFVCVSALKSQAIDQIFRTVAKVRDGARNATLTTGELNRLIQDALIRNPPSTHKIIKKRLKILYVTLAFNERYAQIPVPTLILFVNDKRLMSENYQAYLENRIRDHQVCLGLPIPFSVRSRNRK